MVNKFVGNSGFVCQGLIAAIKVAHSRTSFPCPKAEFSLFQASLGYFLISWQIVEKWDTLACLTLRFTSFLSALYFSHTSCDPDF